MNNFNYLVQKKTQIHLLQKELGAFHHHRLIIPAAGYSLCFALFSPVATTL